MGGLAMSSLEELKSDLHDIIHDLYVESIYESDLSSEVVEILLYETGEERDATVDKLHAEVLDRIQEEVAEFEARADDIIDNMRGCPRCGGSGGGPEAHLKCPKCGGSGG